MQNVYDKKEIGLLVSNVCFTDNSKLFEKLKNIFKENNKKLEIIVVPPQNKSITPFTSWKTPNNVLPIELLKRVDVAFAANDVATGKWSDALALFGVMKAAPYLKLLQISWIGIDFPIVQELLHKKNFMIANAKGANAIPIATSALAGMLSLNRALNYWMISKSKLNQSYLHTAKSNID